MLASRRFLEEKSDYRPLLQERIEQMLARMQQSPVLSAESYPDTCWIFDNLISLCAVRLADSLDGTDHSQFSQQWLALAKRKLVDQQTGLLITSYTTAGKPLKGPEGSSTWMVAHCLRLLDEDFARDQYQRARKEFGQDLGRFRLVHQMPGFRQGTAEHGRPPDHPILGNQRRSQRDGLHRREFFRGCRLPHRLGGHSGLFRIPFCKGRSIEILCEQPGGRCHDALRHRAGSALGKSQGADETSRLPRRG